MYYIVVVDSSRQSIVAIMMGSYIINAGFLYNAGLLHHAGVLYNAGVLHDMMLGSYRRLVPYIMLRSYRMLLVLNDAVGPT